MHGISQGLDCGTDFCLQTARRLQIELKVDAFLAVR